MARSEAKSAPPPSLVLGAQGAGRDHGDRQRGRGGGRGHAPRERRAAAAGGDVARGGGGQPVAEVAEVVGQLVGHPHYEYVPSALRVSVDRQPPQASGTVTGTLLRRLPSPARPLTLQYVNRPLGKSTSAR